MICLLFVFFPLIYYIYVRKADILYRKRTKTYFCVSFGALPLISSFLSFFLLGYWEWDLSILSRQMSLFFSISAIIECLILGIIMYDKKNARISSLVSYSLFPIVQIIFLELIRFSGNRFPNKSIVLFLLGSLFGVIGDLFILHILINKPSKERIRVDGKEMEDTIKVNREAFSQREKEFSSISIRKKEYKEMLLMVLEESKGGNYSKAKALISNYTEKECSEHEDYFCDNKYVNAILCEKAAVCKAEGIQFIASACVPRNLKVSSVSLCSLLGNLLDNAINSCRVFSGQGKKIEVRTGIQGDYLMLFVDNSADDNSQKKDFSRKHYGLEIVKEIVTENGGHFISEYAKKEKRFCSEVAFLLDGGKSE